jgi:hypothetical protein
MISPQTMKSLKDWGQLLGYSVAVPIGLFGLVKAIYEVGASRKQRAEELRWKQAQSAKELLDDIHNHDLAKQAIHMLDWVDGSAEYKIDDDARVIIDFPYVLKALALNHGDVTEAQAYVRDCFDWFFYRIDRIEHYIRRGLIQFEDVADVFKVYAREVALHERVFNDFLQFHEYNLARHFFARYVNRPEIVEDSRRALVEKTSRLEP